MLGMTEKFRECFVDNRFRVLIDPYVAGDYPRVARSAGEMKDQAQKSGACERCPNSINCPFYELMRGY